MNRFFGKLKSNRIVPGTLKREFVGTINQTGFDAPVLTTFKNNFDGLTLSYTSPGVYSLFSTKNEFKQGKTWFMLMGALGLVNYMEYVDEHEFVIYTASDGQLLNAPIEIRVYE